MRRMIAVKATAARCQAYSINVLTMDSTVTGAQLCQNSSCFPWQCLLAVSAVAMGGGRPISSFDELLPMTVQTTSWWMLLIADLQLMFLSGSSARYCWMLGLKRPIRDLRRSGRSSGGLWQ